MASRFEVRRRRWRWAIVFTLGLLILLACWASSRLDLQAAPDDRTVVPPPKIIAQKPAEPAAEPRASSPPDLNRQAVAQAPAGPAAKPSPPALSPPGAAPVQEQPQSLRAEPPAAILQAQPAPTPVEALIAAAKQALLRGDLIAARTQFSEAVHNGIPSSDAAVVRNELSRLAQETVLSGRIVDGDPFVNRYIVQPGDSLMKIAAANKVTVELLAQVNGIRDKNMIRAGQTLKIIKGPFRATVNKSSYSLDVYLENTLIRHFPVGLGAEDSTPTGSWQVATKLVNPTYYPPRGGPIVAADDPENPLGERWIGLTGVSGNAVGQERYGIHGTNEPESIGKSVSLGCVRMRNEDVEAVYDYLIEKHSTVTIVE